MRKTDEFKVSMSIFLEEKANNMHPFRIRTQTMTKLNLAKATEIMAERINQICK